MSDWKRSEEPTTRSANEQTMIELDEYRKLVDECAGNRIDQIIPNGSLQHALVLIAKLFDTARREAAIVSSFLTDTNESGEIVYADIGVVESAKNFLRRDQTKLVIMIEHVPMHGNDNAFLRSVIDDPLRKGDVRLLLNCGEVSKGLGPHYMVTDALSYRRQIMSTTRQAVANFGDVVTGKRLRDLFAGAEKLAKQHCVRILSFSEGMQYSLT